MSWSLKVCIHLIYSYPFNQIKNSCFVTFALIYDHLKKLITSDLYGMWIFFKVSHFDPYDCKYHQDLCNQSCSASLPAGHLYYYHDLDIFELHILIVSLTDLDLDSISQECEPVHQLSHSVFSQFQWNLVHCWDMWFDELLILSIQFLREKKPDSWFC